MKFIVGKVLPIIFIFSGLLLVITTLFPILLFPRSPRPIDPTDVSPYPVPVYVDDLGAVYDYSSASEWFTAPVALPPAQETSVKFFSLTIPRLNLINVSVEVNGSELNNNAIHFPGTALPGEYGNSVIIGHSALPQLYRSGNPLTIFNPLVSVITGDIIVVNFDGVVFRYSITKITEVEPDAVDVLTQAFDRREMTLITCVPLGTYWRRLVVRAELVKS